MRVQDSSVVLRIRIKSEAIRCGSAVPDFARQVTAFGGGLAQMSTKNGEWAVSRSRILANVLVSTFGGKRWSKVDWMVVGETVRHVGLLSGRRNPLTRNCVYGSDDKPRSGTMQK